MDNELLTEPLIIDLQDAQGNPISEEPLELSIEASQFIMAETKRLDMSLEDTVVLILTEALNLLTEDPDSDQ